MTCPSQKPSSKIWAIQKEIKEAYPKKVCHMPKRHKKKSAKKREKMHTQRRYATCPQDMSKKKRRRKNIAHVQEKNTRREIDHTKEFIHYPPKIFPHTCTS